MKDKTNKNIGYKDEIFNLLEDCYITLPDEYNFTSERAYVYLKKWVTIIEKNYGHIIFLLNLISPNDSKEVDEWSSRFNVFIKENEEILLRMSNNFGSRYVYIADTTKKVFCEYVGSLNRCTRELTDLCSKALSKTKRNPENNTVFVVHGHDEKLKATLSKALKKDGYNSIVLSEMSDSGITLFDKFEKYANRCVKAIILMTKDDLVVKEEEKYYQARPNVLIEYGFFLNMLDRNDIVVLLEKGCKKPSDIDGVSYIEYDRNLKTIIRKILDSLKV